MLGIRDFARLGEVPMSTLRYYDEIGLLRPVHVDHTTGHRFYTIDQLPRLHRILAFKELGIELGRIIQLLDEALSSEALSEMLELKQTELRQRIQAEQEQIVRIEARLKTLQQSDNTSPAQDVVLKTVRPQTVFSCNIRKTDFFQEMASFDTLLHFLEEHHVKPSGHVFYLHDDSKYCPTELEVGIGVPIEQRSARTLDRLTHGQYRIHEFPEIPRVASILHAGNPQRILQTYQALGEWIEANDYAIAGPSRKICIRREGNPDDYLIEIQFPVQKLA